MKKLLILAAILTLPASISAVTCSFTVTTPETAPGGYLPGDTITIELVADYLVSGFGISRITDDVPTTPVDLTGTYDGISVWSGFVVAPENGDNYLVNSNNWLVDNAAGVAVGGSILPGPGDPFIGYDGTLLTYTYRISNDYSLIGRTITITPGVGTGGQNFATAATGPSATPTGCSFNIVTPPGCICPTCPGDENFGGTVTFQELVDFLTIMGNRDYNNIPYGDPDYNPCFDINGDCIITFQDLVEFLTRMGNIDYNNQTCPWP